MSTYLVHYMIFTDAGELKGDAICEWPSLWTREDVEALRQRMYDDLQASVNVKLKDKLIIANIVNLEKL